MEEGRADRIKLASLTSRKNGNGHPQNRGKRLGTAHIKDSMRAREQRWPFRLGDWASMKSMSTAMSATAAQGSQTHR